MSMGCCHPNPAMQERLRRIFFSTDEERASDEQAERLREEESRKLEATAEEMGHAEALWTRLCRRWQHKHTRATWACDDSSAEAEAYERLAQIPLKTVGMGAR